MVTAFCNPSALQLCYNKKDSRVGKAMDCRCAGEHIAIFVRISIYSDNDFIHFI